jgi:signal transduction histidine kinase
VLELDAEIEVGELPKIDADPTQMRQLMQNLVSNALKFHREDAAPRVRIEAEVLASQGPRFPGETSPTDRVCVRVSDNGIGFDQKHEEKVFRAFQQLHARNQYEGNGIGLSIARRIVWRHGGDIKATGAPAEGATFTVTLPISHARATAPNTATKTAPTTADNGAHTRGRPRDDDRGDGDEQTAQRSALRRGRRGADGLPVPARRLRGPG